MSFRARLLAALGAVSLIPLIAIALGVRREMTSRLTTQYERRVAALSTIAREDIAVESASIASRLEALSDALEADNRFRLGAVRGSAAERSYVLDYAEHAMRTAGLSMLQIQDEDGRILSSGHFRNEFGRLEPELPALLAASPGGAALVRARTPEGPILVLAGVDSVQIGARHLAIVGGIPVNGNFLGRIARGDELAVTLVSRDGVVSSDSALAVDTAAIASIVRSTPEAKAGGERAMLVAEVEVPYIGVAADGGREAMAARLLVTHPMAELRALLRSVDRWFLAAMALAAAAALLLAAWLASALSHPLRQLAATTRRIDLDRLDVGFATDRDDEIGALSRTLGAMTRRLRSSTAKLRHAERRATVGDLARQVNHDIKNGLAPIRNVLRHLGQVATEHPENLAEVFIERRHTLDASVTYLDTLARNYARLTPRLDLRPCDPNGIAREAIAAARSGPRAELRLQLDDGVPAVAADPLVLRRILENLLSNAIDGLEEAGGTVTVATERTADGAVRITVADTGHGMTREQLARAFDNFHTTKPHGTGLGLSIVRRLVADLHGALRIETEPGAGTAAIITLDAARREAPLPPPPPPATPDHSYS